MNPETHRQENFRRALFALLAIAVPLMVGYEVYFQASTGALDFALDGRTGLALEVPRDSTANYSGIMAGDIILTVDGVPFTQWHDWQIGTHDAEIERDGLLLTRDLLVLPLVKVNLFPLVSAAIVAMAFWGVSLLLLLRRFGQKEIRHVFIIGQTIAITLLFPMAHPGTRSAPPWSIPLSVTCLSLSASLILHYYLTFPVTLGASRQRRWGLGALYGLALASSAGWLSGAFGGRQIGILYTSVVIMAALAVMSYVYLRRAAPGDRRRLRVVVLSAFLAGLPAVLFYLLPEIVGHPYQVSIGVAGLFTIIAPLGYLYATVHHNLFGIDRLLNRTLVYAILSLGILVLYLGPFLLIYRFAPGDTLAQVMLAAALTLLVGLGFDWTRTRVQRLADRLFYGGWYDYPGVVETISDALARSIERGQLTKVLALQVPALMQLRTGHLWIGAPGQSPDPPSSDLPFSNPALQFSLAFQNQTRAVWTVEPRRDGDDLSDADRRILKTLARQAETALGNVLLVETLRRQLEEIRASRETLAQAQRQLLHSREEERARLARDLHDGPIQALVGLNLQTGLMLSQWDRLTTSPALVEVIKDVRAQVRDLLSDLREVCAELRPPMLDMLGLGAALRALTEDWSAQHDISIHFDLLPDATLRMLPEDAAVNLYRVVQEALTNIARHAGASQVNISLTWKAGGLVLTVQDDGRGFVLPQNSGDLAAQGHFGLVGMQERVNLIGGQLVVESAPGQGTSVRVIWEQDIGTRGQGDKEAR